MEHIVYLVEPTEIVGQDVKFKYKMPQLPNDRPNTMYIELLQVQLDVEGVDPNLDGLDIRLMTQGLNYVSTDNNGICLGLIAYIRTASAVNFDYSYLTNANSFKVLIDSHQDWLEFQLYDITNTLIVGAIGRCKMVLKITYPETPTQIPNDYRRQIPLPSRLI